MAEVSSNHNRNLERCLAFIDKAAEIGCGAIKFQLFKIKELFAPEILAKSDPDIQILRFFDITPYKAKKLIKKYPEIFKQFAKEELNGSLNLTNEMEDKLMLCYAIAFEKDLGGEFEVLEVDWTCSGGREKGDKFGGSYWAKYIEGKNRP